MKDAIILFAHGSRDPQWAAPMRTIQTLLSRKRPDSQVLLAFLELMSPDLESAVGDAAEHGARSITIAPLFLAAGGHLKKDLPELVARCSQSFPQLKFEVLTPIGESEVLLGAIADWVCDSLR